MKISERTKFFILGIGVSFLFILFINSTTAPDDGNEIGRFQVSSASSEVGTWIVILDTKTGDYLVDDKNRKAKPIKRNYFLRMNEAK